MGVHCCLHVNCIFYKHFDMSLHIRSLDSTCVQNFRPVPLTIFEIQGFKLKSKNDDKKKKWRNRIFAISPMVVVLQCTEVLVGVVFKGSLGGTTF